MHPRFILCGLAFTVLPACFDTPADPDPMQPAGDTDPGDPDPNGDPDPGGNPAPTSSDLDAAVTAAHSAGSFVVSEGQMSATIAAEGVWMASQSAGTGGLVTTGTLTQVGQQFSYAPTPTDRLVVELTGQDRIEVEVSAMEGDFSGSATGFLQGDHRFEYAVALGDRADVQFSSVRQAGAMEAGARGTATLEGIVYDLDLVMRGTYYFESDSSGSEFRDQYRITGSVTADAFDLDVDESWDFEMVTTSGDSAQSATRTVTNSLTLGGDVLDWVDVVTRKSFRQGKPSQIDTFWQASGQVFRNGNAYGQYRLDPQVIDEEGNGFIGFVLDTPEGTTVLEKHNAY